MEITKLRDYDYGEDRLIVADMDKRDTSYVVMLQKKLNEVVDILNREIEIRKNVEKEFEKRVSVAEEKAAEDIKEA